MNPERMLVIDDEPGFGALVRRVGEWCGYEVMVTTGSDAFKKAHQEHSPDVVAIDLAMPAVDGVELLRHLAEVGSRAKVLIASGIDRRTRETAVRLGAALGLNMAGIIAKPMRVAELRELLMNVRKTA